MNNFQYIVKGDTRAAMHMAVELCERGVHEPTAYVLAKIAVALGVSADELLGVK